MQLAAKKISWAQLSGLSVGLYGFTLISIVSCLTQATDTNNQQHSHLFEYTSCFINLVICSQPTNSPPKIIFLLATHTHCLILHNLLLRKSHH